MEQQKDQTPHNFEDEHRNAIVYIEALANSIVILPWRIHKFFKRSKSNTYMNLHNVFTGVHKGVAKDEAKIGVAATGFFVAPDLLVTNIHVVASKKTIAAKQLIVKRIEVSEDPILSSSVSRPRCFSSGM